MNYTETDNLSDGNVHQTIMRWLTKQMFGFLGGDLNRVPGNEKCFFQTLFDGCIPRRTSLLHPVLLESAPARAVFPRKGRARRRKEGGGGSPKKTER